jgi:hypothetical protein
MQQELTVKTFADLMHGQKKAEIYCLMTGDLVRKLTVAGVEVEIEPVSGPRITVQLKTEITFEPWFMDRGSLLFQYCEEDESKKGKICTELDIIRFPDGSEFTIRVNL